MNILHISSLLNVTELLYNMFVQSSSLIYFHALALWYLFSVLCVIFSIVFREPFLEGTLLRGLQRVLKDL
jgi:hypothetical protein